MRMGQKKGLHMNRRALSRLARVKHRPRYVILCEIIKAKAEHRSTDSLYQELKRATNAALAEEVKRNRA